MSVYFRYFRVTKGPVMDEVLRLIDQRNEAGKEINALGEELGATPYHYGRGGGIAGFKFSSPPNLDVWRKPNKDGLTLPRKNSPTGKDIWIKIKGLKKYPDINSALSLAGLGVGFPCLFEGLRAYSAVLWGNTGKGVLFVKVPWRDEDPGVMEKYKIERASGKHISSNLDHLLWEPPGEWEEIKEWQALKETEEVKAS